MKRPVFLTIWLGFLTIANIYSLYSYTLGAAAITRIFPAMTGMMLGLYALLVFVNLVGVYFLWTWKIVGFYIRPVAN